MGVLLPMLTRASYLVFIGLLMCRVTSAQVPPDLVKADLVTDATAVQPGKAFTVGIRLKIKPGWHVYWINPGDSGAPTTVKWKLPEGFVAGPVQFPVPQK